MKKPRISQQIMTLDFGEFEGEIDEVIARLKEHKKGQATKFKVPFDTFRITRDYGYEGVERFVLIGERDMTPDEIKRKKQEEKKIRDQREQREREQWEVLQKKFGPKN
jgi:hypothetical protein